MRLQGEFAMFGGGPVSDKTRRAFERDGLQSPPRMHFGGAAGPIEELIAGWFFLEQTSPGFAGALAGSAVGTAVGAVTHIVKRMTKWFRSGESPAPADVPHRIIVAFGAIDDPDRLDVSIELGPQYTGEEIEGILRAALEARKPADPDGDAQG
ncbi:hypothetical protein [Kocuria rosea]|uniref:Uncharacterized protein n=1 Tax=Kocuria rosea subsp. polaris TaxID=136273 RepID=A0A0A6YAS5_KOCRO|nr:hypothetical protein [Kocuria polaris]KHD96447.1 hypothetical protein GY22_15755 [Kocuria polaris]